MSLQHELQSALIQVVAISLFSLFVYGIRRLIHHKTHPTSFLKFMGLQFERGQWDRNFFWIALGAMLWGGVLVAFQFAVGDIYRELLFSQASPYARMLKEGLTPAALFAGVVYCFLQASLSEEMFFRGLIARRLYPVLGNRNGNLVQALLFWLMHLVIFRLITGEWFSGLQLLVLFTSFTMGLVLGYVNFRKAGQSIWPSVVLHGAANLSSFLALATLIPGATS